MISKVFMPKVGMSMESGVILKWLKKVGDPVEKGEPLLEIETDKVAMEIESNDAGYLVKIVRNEGETVPVIETIGYIGTTAGETVSDSDQASDANGAPVQAEQTKKNATDANAGADYDVIVVGGGPAGYVAAIRAAQLGGKVLLFEKDAELGGTCLNRGCIPTKAYLHTAEVLRTIGSATEAGVKLSGGASVDMKAVLERKAGIVKKLTGGVAALLKSNGVTVIHSEATVKSGSLVHADGKDYTSNAVIFAGGSKPAVIPVEGAGLAKVLDSTALLELDTIPERLVIIGGGVIGVEFACAFSAFSSKVTIIEMADQLLPGMDEEIAAALKKQLKSQGIEIHTSAKLERIQDGAPLTVHTDAGTFEADNVLMAVGRKPDISGLSEAGVKTERGAAVVDERMCTSVKNLYVAGDANAKCMLAHAAYHMAECAAENAMGTESSIDMNNIPSCVYTFPEVASVGLTEKAAAANTKVKVGKFNLAANGRALAAGETAGFVKVVTDASTNELLGVQMIGHGATEMINMASVMLHLEMTADEMQRVIIAHPTCSEAVKEACADSIGLSIHNIHR